jgi:hypothetical protein
MTMKSLDAWWAVLRRGVLCAAVRPRTWMCPTLELIAQGQRHKWLLRRTARLTAAWQVGAPSSYVWRSCLPTAVA